LYVVRRALAAAAACVGFAMAWVATPADAQCQILQQPSQFDPPAVPPVPADMFTRADSLAIGGPATARRLVVRYSYGFLVYDLGNPGAPGVNQTRSLKLSDGYPKNGDGLERTNSLAMSSDGKRVVVPWTDTAGFGTVALSLGTLGFSGGGDFAPTGDTVTRTAIARVGSRYIGFSLVPGSTSSKLYAADLTTLQQGVTASDATKNMIPSELVAGVGFGGRVGKLTVVEGSSRVYVLASAPQTVTVLDVTTVGASVPGLTSSFTARSYSLAELGISSGILRSLAGAVHPVDGSLHIYVEAAVKPGTNNNSTGVSLTRIHPATGQPSVVGSYYDPASPTVSLGDGLLLPFDSSLVAVFFGRNVGQGLDVQVRSSAGFAQNLASGLRFTPFDLFSTVAGFRTGGTIHLYFGRGVLGTYAASLNCATAPAPAAASLSVERVPATGPAEPVLEGGTVYVGDTLRIKPFYSPPDSIQPLLDWRLDYDFHSGNALDSSATPMRLSNADESRTKGPLLPNAEYLLTGPCDPKGLADGGGAVPSTGVGCWASVTSNGAYTTSGNPDFVAPPAEPAAGSTKELTIGFEAQNALNAGGSSLATYRINWKVPAAVLKSSALLAGGSVEIEPQGRPADTGFKWYFASAPAGQAGENVLSLRAGCTGPSCNPALTQSGSYRYWVTVPYRNGFRTPACPGLSGDLQSCTGDAAKTVQVSAVVLSLTVPTGGIVGNPTLTLQSQSARAPIVTSCPTGSTGFTYDLCTVNGGTCPEGSYSGPGLLAQDPFPTSGTGSLTIPMPAEGAWGLRLKYTYTTAAGNCTQSASVKWPPAGAAVAWAPVTVTKPRPTIRLRNWTDTADISFQPGFGYSMTTGQMATAWAEVNGVRDTAPPAGMQWSYTSTSTGQSVNFGTTQGAPFSISTVDIYTVGLSGYSQAATPVTVDVSAPVGDPPIVTSVTFSKVMPAVGEPVTVSCQASQGTFAIGGYQISFGDSESYTGTAPAASHAWASEGTKSVRCVAVDINGLASTALSALIDVGGPDTGPTVTAIAVTPELPHPGILVNLTCSATAPPGRLIAGYEFDFGDSSPPVNGPSNVASHVYQAAGSYPATCRAYDASGRSGSLLRNVAVYEPTYSLQVTRIGSGSGLVSSTPAGLSCGPTCSTDLEGGSSVTLGALPAAGSRFAGWSGSGCQGTGPCTVLMTAARRVSASFLPESGAAFHALTPCRVADTRIGGGLPLAAGEVRELPVIGSGCAVPSAIQAAALNVTVTQATSQGFLTIFPAGAEVPDTQTVSFSPGRTRAAPTIIQIGNGGAVSAYNASNGPVHVILDVSGVFQ
jgi:hypothetical protein